MTATVRTASIARSGASSRTGLAAAWAWVAAAFERFLQRQELGRLDGAQLQDIGLSHAQAQFESARPFWQKSRREA